MLKRLDDVIPVYGFENAYDHVSDLATDTLRLIDRRLENSKRWAVNEMWYG